jgi:Helicase conserved C-terminal domain
MFHVIGAIIAVILIIIVLAWRLLWYEFSGREDDKFGAWSYSGGTSPDKYQKKVLKEYRHLRPSKNRIPYSEFCHGKKGFKIQPQQKLIGEYMEPHRGAVPTDSLLVVHKIGAGKTCLSIQVGLKWRGTKTKLASGETKDASKPLYVMPASLIPGFRAELRSKCAGTDYITAAESSELVTLKPGSAEYNEIIARSDERINKDFIIMSYNKFASAMSVGASKVAAPVLIVDELQNVNSPGGKYYAAVRKWTEKYAGPIILMSATPLFDSAEEINSLAVLMRLNPQGVISPEDIPRLFAGKVSYYEGAPDYTFPDVMVRVKKCKMSPHQAKWYRAQVEAEMKKSGDIKLRNVAESFYIKSRQKSNIVYPKGLTGQAGLNLLTANKIRSDLDKYSAKYSVLVRKLLRSHGPESLSFVYTGFTGAGGISALKKCLGAVGYKDYLADGPGKRRYVVWSGEETLREKQTIRDVFNSPENNDASQIQVVIGSSAIKEGVSLMRVRTVHLLETYWNLSQTAQIIGRAVRYCSHKTLPARDRSVLVYIYAAVTGDVSKEPQPEESIDLYMLNIAEKKRDDITPYMDAFADVAIDRLVHYP